MALIKGIRLIYNLDGSYTHENYEHEETPGEIKYRETRDAERAEQDARNYTYELAERERLCSTPSQYEAICCSECGALMGYGELAEGAGVIVCAAHGQVELKEP